MPGAREMPTDQEADARVRAGALPGGLVRPLGAKASGSEGLRERGCVAGPQTAPGRQMCPVLKCFWPIPPCRHSAEPGQPRPPGPPMHTGAPGSCPPPAGLDHKLGKQCALGALQPSSPGPLLVGESAPRRLAQTSARAQEGLPATLSAVPACKAGLGPRGAGSQPPLLPSGAWAHLTVHLS